MNYVALLWVEVGQPWVRRYQCIRLYRHMGKATCNYNLQPWKVEKQL